MELIDDETWEAIGTLLALHEQRGHAPWFHADRRFQKVMETDAAWDFAEVVNDRYRWSLRGIQSNPAAHPDCLLDFGPGGDSDTGQIGVEVTELVDQAAIMAHQEEQRLFAAGDAATIDSAKLVELSRRKYPLWSVDDFVQRVIELVRKKDLRSRPCQRSWQFLLVVTDEPSLGKANLERYVNALVLPALRNIDAVFLMTSYTPRIGVPGHYPVFRLRTAKEAWAEVKEAVRAGLARTVCP